jgi:hypothetical protein
MYKDMACAICVLKAVVLVSGTEAMNRFIKLVMALAYLSIQIAQLGIIVLRLVVNVPVMVAQTIAYKDIHPAD